MHDHPIDLSVVEITEAERNNLADMLFEIGAIKFGAFKLKLHETQPDAPLSPIYINLRAIRSYPAVLSYVCGLLDKISCRLTFDLFADIPTAATPIVAVLTYKSGRPMISPRKEAKGYGLGVAIDGDYKSGQTVLLVDDLVSKADSKFEAIEKLEKAGLIVRDLLMVIDRQQGGVELLAVKGYAVHAAATIAQLLERYLDTGAITRERYDEVRQYLKST
jgi:uridine monophosphate synthetase